jgi:hypothetical protein
MEQLLPWLVLILPWFLLLPLDFKRVRRFVPVTLFWFFCGSIIFQMAGVFDDDHGAVFEVGKALARLSPSFDDVEREAFARQKHRLDRVGELVDAAVARLEQAGETDEQYEGCLSFFDVRGQVPRSQVIHVEHTTIDGATKITVFERGVARLAAHEVDHLHGHLYRDRMRPGVEPIPVEQYRGTGTDWKY